MRLHLVDGTYELYRAHFSKRPGHTGPDGQDLKATVGIASAMLRLLERDDEAVTHIAVAFDNPIRSFRNDMFDAYKSDEGVPPELRAQFDTAEEAVRAVGIKVWSMDRWEADDALASAAVKWADAVDQVRILTPDKDLGQVVSGTQVVQVDLMRDKFIDEDAVRAKWGVAPASIPDLLGLMGDDADGIPGIPGFGAKTAATLLARYGTVDEIPDAPEDWDVKVRGAPRLAATLAEHRDDARLYRDLAVLATDVPLDEGLDALEYRGTPREHWAQWCEAVAAPKMADRPKRWM